MTKAGPKMGRWKKAPQELLDRFSEALVAAPGAEARKMFGYPAAFVNGQMFTGIFADRMFLRLEAEAHRLAQAFIRLRSFPGAKKKR